jgi:electron transport complex protein RnfD
MLHVLLALLPAYAMALLYFGLGALIVSLFAVICCVGFEWVICRALLKTPSSTGDLSAVVTGVLLSFNLPSNLPLWMVAIGALVAIGIGKMSFGGLGQNIFNPALVGRVFLLLCFPVQMTSFPRPLGLWDIHASYIDAETAATPLYYIKWAAQTIPDKMDLLWGNIGGSMGEVSAIALIAGGIYLLGKRIITWHIPTTILATVALLTTLLHLINPAQFVATADIHLLTGGVLLGAFFMATDYVTSPMTLLGQSIYGILIGIIIVVIRAFGNYPEGVSFAILLMNGASPLLNRLCPPKRFLKRQ